MGKWLEHMDNNLLSLTSRKHMCVYTVVQSGNLKHPMTMDDGGGSYG